MYITQPIVAERTHLTFLTPGDVLKGRVEPTIWMRMCHAFAAKGLDVEMVTVYAYRNENVARHQIFEHYGLTEGAFKLTILPTPFSASPPLFWYRSWTAMTNLIYAYYQALIHKHRSRFDHLIFYSRSPVALLPYLYVKRHFKRPARVSCFFETHALPTARGAVSVASRVDGLVVNSKKLAADMVELLHLNSNRVHVAYLAPNAAPVSANRQEALKQLHLRPDHRYIVYTGKLLMSEVRLLLSAAEVLSTSMPTARMIFVGGNHRILADCRAEVGRRKLSNVVFTGFVPPAHVGLYQKAADVLVLYLVSDRNIINYITPSKVFDYLQAERPIVASNYPILGEILEHDRNALLVTPHQPLALAAELKRVLDEPELAARLSRAGKADSLRYSWEQRTQSIWEFMQGIVEKRESTSMREQ